MSAPRLHAGRPTQEDVQAICSPFAETMLEGLTCSDRARPHAAVPHGQRRRPRTSWRSLLHFNPSKRITAAEGAGAPLRGAVPLPRGGALRPWCHHHLHR